MPWTREEEYHMTFGTKIILKCLKIDTNHYTGLLLRQETQKKKITYPESRYNYNKNIINLMSLAQRVHFMQDVFFPRSANVVEYTDCFTAKE